MPDPQAAPAADLTDVAGLLDSIESLPDDEATIELGSVLQRLEAALKRSGS